MFTALNEKVFFSIVEKSPEPISIHKPVFSSEGEIIDFVLEYFNESAMLQADLPYAIMQGQRISELSGYSSEVRNKLLQQLKEVYTTGNDIRTTYYNELLDIHFDVHRRKVDGAVLTIARNINEEVKERQERERQAALVDMILDTSPNGWFVLDAVLNKKGDVIDFVFTRINNGFSKFSGLSQEQVIGKSYLQLFPPTKENGAFDLNVRVFTTGKAERVQMRYVGDGLDAWYDNVITKMGERSLLITFDDVTHQKRTAEEIEQKTYILDQIFAHSSNGISFGQVIRNKEGRIIDGKPIMANEAAIRLTGIPRDLFFSKSSVELEPNIIHTPYFQKIIHTMETGEPSIVEYQLESNGHWIEISLSRMDRDHLIIIFTDVTEIKEAQLQKEQLIEELKRTNIALEEFTRAASHDLKEPIRKVHIFTDRLHQRLAGKMDAEEKGMIEKVENATSRMMLLIEDLLAYSDVSTNNIEQEEIDLNEKVDHVLSDLEVSIEEKGAAIQVSNLPVIKGYRRQLQQLFQNLIGNALKYSQPNRPPVIRISASKIVNEALPGLTISKTYHLIEIKDNGIGFDQKDADKIFNVFTRLHSKSEYAGTGIGLSIVKRVVENHKGAIRAEGAKDKGATFYIYLPAQ